MWGLGDDLRWDGELSDAFKGDDGGNAARVVDGGFHIQRKVMGRRRRSGGESLT